MANNGQVCILIYVSASLSSIGVLFLLDCVNLVINFFLKFVASLYDFLNNSTVTVVLVLNYACLSLFPVFLQFFHYLRLDIIDFQFNVFLATFKL